MNTATNPFPRRFVFHGNAVAAGVFLTRTGETEQYLASPIDAQSSLPVIGGHSEPPVVEVPTLATDIARVFNYRRAHTMADGRVERGVAITRVQSSVSDVSVTNQPSPGEPDAEIPIVFTAAMLSLSLLSIHPLNEAQPTIEFVDDTPLFQGLSLAGLPIELELNVELMRLARWDDLQKNFRTNRQFFESCRDSFAPIGQGRAPTFGQKIPCARGSFSLCSFVRNIRWGGRTIPGHVLTQPGFGTIYFGEILLNDRERRVTMVRMQLESCNIGQAVFAEADPNGTPWPPPP
jgi:hypothetical protein